MTNNDILQAVLDRQSVRAFTSETVPRETVESLLRVMQRAPSGANLQPGRFTVLTGKPLQALITALDRAIAEGRPEVAEYSYFPTPMPAHLKARQREAGYALAAALGIEKRDIAARRAQFAKNFCFFDAPVGIVVSIERAMGKGCYMDLGMALQTFFIAAVANGLATCGIGALAKHADVVHRQLDLPDDELVVCGIALGWPDRQHPVNRFRTTRLPLEAVTTWRGFDT